MSQRLHHSQHDFYIVGLNNVMVALQAFHYSASGQDRHDRFGFILWIRIKVVKDGTVQSNIGIRSNTDVISSDRADPRHRSIS